MVKGLGKYIHQLCVDTGRGLQELSSAMADKDKWWQNQRNAVGTFW